MKYTTVQRAAQDGTGRNLWVDRMAGGMLRPDCAVVDRRFKKSESPAPPRREEA